MDKIILFAPDIASTNELPADEASHCIKVLRKKEGDPILITDGKGNYFDATIVQAHPKHCFVNITDTIKEKKNMEL